MPTDVRCLVRYDEPRGLVELVGVLDLPAAGALRGSLLTCLADRGDLVVDVSRLRVEEPAALSVFQEVTVDSAQWPAGRMTVHVPAGSATAMWDQAGVPVYLGLPEAFARLAGPDPVPGPAELYAELRPIVGAARQGRDLVTEGCLWWDLPELAGSACIVVTELVNNVVAHAGTAMTVRLAVREGAVRLAVRDWSTAVPTYGGPVGPRSAGGRGLLLVDTVSRRWGSTVIGDGKVVWVVLHPDDEPPGS